MKYSFRLLSILIGSLLGGALIIPANAATLTPNDPGFVQQWYLRTIKAPEAWAKGKELRGSLGQGSPDVVIAIIDSGVDIDHPDLKENIWTNPREIPDNAIDDDTNGFVDDVHGWDFLEHSPDPRPKLNAIGDLTTNPLGVHHGTILAGLAGASGDNQEGIAGVAWRISIMPLRVIRSDGTGEAVTVAQAMQYAIANHANIINLSFVGETNNPLLQDIIRQAQRKDILVVSAAGNEVKESNGATTVFDLDLQRLFPICHDDELIEQLIIGVTATNENDQKSSFASFGRRCIDLAAPGSQIIAPRATNAQFGVPHKYGYPLEGTSMSTALVSGAAALLKAIVPATTMVSIGEALIRSTDPIDTANPLFAGRLGSGRLNVAQALDRLLANAPSTPAPTADVAAPTPVFPVAPPVGIVLQEKSSVRIKQYTLQDGVRDQWSFSNPISSSSIAILRDNELAVGALPQTPSEVRIFSPTGTLLRSFSPYTKNFRGGVWVRTITSGDVTYLVTIPRQKASGHIRVYRPNGTLIRQLMAGSPSDRNDWIVGNISGEPEAIVIVNRYRPRRAFLVYPLTGIIDTVDIIESAPAIASVSAIRSDGVVTLAFGVEGNSSVVVADSSGGRSIFEAYPARFRLSVDVLWTRTLEGAQEIITAPIAGGAHLRQWDPRGVLLYEMFAASPSYRGGIRLIPMPSATLR